MRLNAYFVPPEIQAQVDSKKQFLEWLKTKYPDIYKQATAAFQGLGDIPATDQPSLLDNIISAVKQILPAYAQYKTQNDLIKLNIQRTAQGLPPVDSASLAPTVNVGASSDVKTIAYVGIGAVLLVAFFALRRR